MSQPNTKTPAMVLQEFTVKHGHSPPEYVLAISKTGTHENEFHYQVNVVNIHAFGFGRSKQVAKHNAASKALEILANAGLYDPNSNPAQEFNAQSHRNESDSPLEPPINYIGTLQEKCSENRLPFPIFREISDVGPPHAREFTYECKLASMTTQSTANTKKQARQLAAKDMLDNIKDMWPELAANCDAESNALTEHDNDAIKIYLSNTLDVIPNRAIEVQDFSLTIKKIMDEKNLTFQDFAAEFLLKDIHGLDYIFEKLDVKYEIKRLYDNPPIAIFNVGLETPFTIISLGKSREEPEEVIIKDIYEYLEVFMKADCSAVN